MRCSITRKYVCVLRSTDMIFKENNEKLRLEDEYSIENHVTPSVTKYYVVIFMFG